MKKILTFTIVITEQENGSSRPYKSKYYHKNLKEPRVVTFITFLIIISVLFRIQI